MATSGNDLNSQQWQWQGQATVAETDAVVGVTTINQKAAAIVVEMAFVAAAAATVAMLATAAVQMAAVVQTDAVAVAQMAAVATGVREIHIKKGRKRRSEGRWRQPWRLWGGRRQGQWWRLWQR
jgi:hypothetical protein